MDVRRRGFSLLEMMVVLAILVIIGAAAIPLIKPMIASRQVDAAADVVRTQWSQSRSHAISEGRPYRFAYQENSGKFRIAPDSTKYWSDGELADDESGWEFEGELPGSVQFATGKSSQPASVSDQWTRGATFLADGTLKEQQAEIAFGSVGSRTVTLKLRGSTGAVTASEEKKQ